MFVKALRKSGYEVYDFREPVSGENGFSWRDVDENWQNWTAEEYIKFLTNDPIAAKGFNRDFEAMQWADACVMLMPCGRSANIEAGWFVGAGKPLYIVWHDDCEPELMYLLAKQNASGVGGVVKNLAELQAHLRSDEVRFGKKFCSSTDGEIYSYETYSSRKDAQEDGADEAKEAAEIDGYTKGEREFYTGVVEPVNLSELIDPECLIEDAGENAYDHVGEAAEYWQPEVSELARTEFAEMIDKWAHRHGLTPNINRVTDVEEHTVKFDFGEETS